MPHPTVNKRPIALPAGYNHAAQGGYDQGCRCTPCARAHSVYLKINAWRRANQRLTANQLTDSRPAADHLRGLLAEVPGAGAFTAARAAGVDVTVIARILADPDGRTRVSTLRTLLALTAADLLATPRFVDPTPTIALANQLRAAGYPLYWQARRAGHAVDWHTRPDRKMLSTVAEDWRRLYDQIGLRLATTDDGLRDGDIARVRADAASEGWYPPGCYDDDGQIIPRAIPDHPWSKLDAHAGMLIEVARGLIEGERRDLIAEHLGTNEKRVERAARTTGVAEVDPDRDANTTRVRALLDAYDHHGADPVVTALELGLLKPRLNMAGHPGYDKWVARRAKAAAKAAAKVAA